VATRRSHTAASASPPPTQNPRTAATGRHARLFEPVQHAGDPMLVGDCVLTRVKGRELGDVGARDKGLVTRSPQDHHPYVAGGGQGVGALAGRNQSVVHREGHRVALRGAVEGDGEDGSVPVDQQIFGGRRHVSASRAAPEATSESTSAAV
jgi:hypothetical protein